MNQFNFFNVSISNKSAEALAEQVIARREPLKGYSIHFLAASTFTKYFLRMSFAKNSPSLWLADGKPLERILRLKYDKAFRGLRSIDFVSYLLDKTSTENPVRHMLISSSAESSQSFQEAISKNGNHILVMSVIAPFRGKFDEDYYHWISLIEKSKAEIIWITLGSPKQDIVAYDLSHLTNRCFIAIGAALDFYSGSRLLAPKFFRILYLEWFFRLIQEPKRLWRRYLFGNIRFIFLSIRFFLQKRNSI